MSHIAFNTNLTLFFSRQLRPRLVLNAILGPDSFRFAAMFGTFVSIYKLLINALPLLQKNIPIPDDFDPPLLPRAMSVPVTPAEWNTELGIPWSLEETDDIQAQAQTRFVKPPQHVDRDLEKAIGKEQEEGTISMKGKSQLKVKTKLSTQAAVHQVWIRKRGRRWHAFLAGAIAGGAAVLMERKDRRLAIAQQMFVRSVLTPRRDVSPLTDSGLLSTAVWPARTTRSPTPRTSISHTVPFGSSPSAAAKSCMHGSFDPTPSRAPIPTGFSTRRRRRLRLPDTTDRSSEKVQLTRASCRISSIL